MIIENYDFGKITINGKSYTSDIIIYPDKINSSWWRKNGHNICMDDIKEIIDHKPECIIFGKGNPGLMQVPKEIQDTLENMGIETYVASTKNAIKKYNEIQNKKRTIAAFHLTC